MVERSENFSRSRTWPPKVRAPGQRRSRSSSATRALEILEFFGECRRPLRAVEISRALHLHPSTTNQLLKTMLDGAYLVFEVRTKTYLPSARLFPFGSWNAEAFGGGTWVRTLLADLHAQAGEVVTLTTPNDLFMQVLDVADGGATLHPPRGLQVSMFGSAVGAAYLAGLADEEIRMIAQRARLPPAEVCDVLVGVAGIRRSGFAEGPINADVWSIAARLPPEGSPVPLVLGLSGPEARVRARDEQIRSLMHRMIAERFRDRPRKPGAA